MTKSKLEQFLDLKDEAEMLCCGITQAGEHATTHLARDDFDPLTTWAENARTYATRLLALAEHMQQFKP